MPIVMIDPDGTQALGLLVVILSKTGTQYQHQVGGVETNRRTVEGYLVPVGDAAAAQPLRDFFAITFRGNPPPLAHHEWTLPLLEQLSVRVEQIPFWFKRPNGSDERTTLRLDRDRVDELTEAWVPVLTPEGKGILIFQNSD